MEKGRKREILSMTGCFLTAAVLVCLFFAALILHAGQGEVFDLPGGWEVKRGDRTFENVTVDEMTDLLDNFEWNETVRMSHPLNVQTHDPLTLRVYARLSAIRVMVDNKQIYSYGYANINSHSMAGSGYHFILLPTSYYGKKLTIEMTASEKDAINAAPEICITSAEFAIISFAKERVFGIFSGILLMFVGIFLVLLVMIAIFMDYRFLPLGAIGLFSIASGIWCLSTIKALQIFSGDVTLNSILEYLSMYFLPVPVLFLSRHFRHSASPRAKKIISAATVVSGIFFVAAFILQAANIVDVSNSVVVFHFLLPPLSFVLFFVGNSKWRRMNPSEKMFQTGLIFMASVALLEYVIYYCLDLVYSFSARFINVVIPVSTLIYVVIILIGFLMEIYDMRLKDTEKDRLKRLAYKDQMTGLMNRGMCEERFRELRESGEPFAMMNMDLNGLKLVNDSFGHLMGDQYILTFADIIGKALRDEGKIYRVGGDEFLYIATGKTEDDLWNKVKFIRRLEKIVARDEKVPFSIDASFGIATSLEVESGDPEDVYILADKRMYQMKKNLKKERA
ncbi:MAG: GGDEF domain-containing protein [Lachnospiraceae bacterium]|nr:GGDEF domain-containing protein [Lachnospiraceae bacterium]